MIIPQRHNEKEMKHYSDYYWNEGIPRGISPITIQDNSSAINYKLVSDPYHKWISIEKYKGSLFDKIIYDSLIFDFRSLKMANQTAWEKKLIDTSTETYMIRNQDDRIVLIEEYFFDGDFCKMCNTRSVHGVPISKQKIYYKDLGDHVNGVALFDNNDHMVMYKLYNLDAETKEFTDIIEENWNMKKYTLKKSSF